MITRTFHRLLGALHGVLLLALLLALLVASPHGIAAAAPDPTGNTPSNTAATATPPPVAAFFQNPSFSGAKLSPSGKLLALRVGAPGARDRLAVLDLGSTRLTPVASFSDADVIDFHWVNEQRLVFDLADRRLAAGERRFARGLFAVNADGSGYRQLVMREQVFVQNGLVTTELPWNTFLLPARGRQDNDEVFVVQPAAVTSKGFDHFKLLRLNTVTGRATEVDAPPDAFEWLIDDQGELRAVRTARGGRAALHWREPSGTWRRLREFDRYTGSDLALRFMGPDGKLYVSAAAWGPMQAVGTYDPATNQLSARPLLSHPQFDLQPDMIASDSRLLGMRLHIDAEVTQWFDDTMKAHQAEVDRLLPATANLLTPPRRGDSPWMLVRAFADVQPALYFLYDTRSRKLTRLGGEQPAIDAAQMSAMDLVRYKARDGLEIPAWLTLPHSAAAKKNLPLIVYVHGGPWLRGNTWRWQPEVQFLASRGYAVLQPEFRGSTGFGQAHFRAGWKQWGRAMQDDLADGARWAVAQGIADPRRICIMGASYGGYATLMGLVKDGDLFRCGVQWLGVSDLLLLYDAGWSDISDAFKQFGLAQLVGDRQQDAAMLAANSPLQQAARIRNPLLMAYGRADRRVPVAHGRTLAEALKAHNKDVDYVEYADEGHGWALPATEVDWWTRVEAFLARQLAPQK